MVEPYIKITKSAVKKNIKCGVPQGSTLLLMLYGNNLPNSSNLLVSLMFPDDTDFFFFCEHSNINTLFKAVNDKLNKINKWFSANKLSLNVANIKFLLFHKSCKNISPSVYQH